MSKQMVLPYGLDRCNVRFRRIKTNGIELNVAEAGEGQGTIMAAIAAGYDAGRQV